jgi:hypothetical protein
MITHQHRVEAMTVCVGYDDFLNVAARHNRGLFDRWVIVTTPQDGATRECCRKWNLEVLLTEEATRDGKFHKGHMIRRAQRLMSCDAWRLHVDADVVLPATFRKALEVADLDPEKIYGADRVCVKSYEAWENLYNSGYLSHQWDYHCRVCFPKGVEVGSRWVSSQQGYAPIGFFQLWHGRSDEFVSFQQRAYPDRHGEASRTDTQHPLQWDRRKRELLGEVIVVHLESEDNKMGVNWEGRRSKRFGPDPDKFLKGPGMGREGGSL